MKEAKAAFAIVLGISFYSTCEPALADDDEDAKELHARGVLLYEQGEYQAAARAFREAYRLRPTWKLLFNVGQCEATIKRYGLAVEAFEGYLISGGDDVPLDRRDYVVEELRRLQPVVGRLDLIAPNGVEVRVDGEHRTEMPLPGPVRISAGTHDVAFWRNGEEVFRKTVNIAGGMTTSVEWHEETPSPSTPTPAPQPMKPVAETVDTAAAGETVEISPKPMTPIGWAAVGTGLAITAAGAVTGALAIRKAGTLEENCEVKSECPATNRDLQTSSTRLATTTDVLLPVGIAVAVMGVVLVILGKRQQRNERALGLQPNGAGLMVEGRF